MVRQGKILVGAKISYKNRTGVVCVCEKNQTPYIEKDGKFKEPLLFALDTLQYSRTKDERSKQFGIKRSIYYQNPSEDKLKVFKSEVSTPKRKKPEAGNSEKGQEPDFHRDDAADEENAEDDSDRTPRHKGDVDGEDL